MTHVTGGHSHINFSHILKGDFMIYRALGTLAILILIVFLAIALVTVVAAL